ncbi:HlyD family secretion protein [Candidatus Methylobacter oryzae]|uniref:HlyD family secretion protein n=1 Tax=Candidatus Methylobacter oryzae TaxID=2497749 RepID=A0ABY3C8Q3_9GAMM|nr:HlyD family secretion protein [Candidatus Methylobacter oryzae]TRW90221.1 HlyD family secretion protein [Candidatus Methylobacter oryzae]
MRFPPKTILILLILISAIAAGTAYWLNAIHPFETTDNTYLKSHPSLISPKETGYVKEVLFDDNRKVMPGDLLVVIDDHDFQARAAQAEAQVLLETAHIRTLETDKRTQSAKIRQQDANIAAAEADLERAVKDVKRFGNLAADGAVSAQTRDTAESAHKQAAAQSEKAHSARQEAESQLASLDAQIVETRARLKAAQAVLELARINLTNTRIVAPIAGIIGNRSVQVGQLVKPGTVLAYLIPSDGLFVEANFKESQIGRMQPGQPVDILVDAYPDTRFEGTVDSFAPASGSEFSLLPPENATGNFTKIVRRVPVKIRFKPGTDLSRLKPGLSTVVKVRVG